MALGLLLPGGLLFAPALASTAFFAGTALGATGAAATAIKGRELSNQAKKIQIVSNQLQASRDNYEKVFVEAIKDFSGEYDTFLC